MRTTLFYYTIALASLLLFLRGFFPIQQTTTSLKVAPFPSSLNDIKLNKTLLYKPQINKLVLIVIDALRLDFIKEENVPFISSVYDREGCMLTVNVESPTVTLPRIKALTTGNIPQFIDVILNLASTEVLTDSLLHKAKQVGKRIVFYGDNTWLKLYPKIFTRHEGVSSFYVSDYTEVDNNVTRNLIKELNNEDWDVMLLHYLGLDHIGHVYGPSSHLIQPKLKEMDDIVKRIYKTLNVHNNSKTLVLITGDHGMKDSGGHGGSTFAETHVPFISIGMPCKDDSVAQTDIPATLASLLGLPHPDNSIGCVISNMLVNLPYERLLYILHYNVMFLKSKMNGCDKLFDEASRLHYDYLKTYNESFAKSAMQLYESCAKEIRNQLINSSINQDFYSLIIGNEILIAAFCAILYNFISRSSSSIYFNFTKIFITVTLILEVTIPKFPLFRIACMVVIGVAIIYYLIWILITIRERSGCDDTNLYVIVASAAHCLSLFSSSFIEEEHQTWYFYFTTLILINCYLVNKKRQKLQWLLLSLAFRLVRTINQTGKWAHLPGLAQWLLLEQNAIFLHLLYIVSSLLIIACFSLFKIQRRALALNVIILLLIYILKNHIKAQNTLLVKIIWFLIALNVCFGFLQKSKCLEYITISWLSFCMLLMRPQNVILLPTCILASYLLCKKVKDVTLLTVIHIWLGQTLFFCQGHSNSLASVDIASGYIGIQEYIPSVVITQVLVHTYTFPVLTNLLMLCNCSLHADTAWTVNILSRLIVLIVTCIVIVTHQQHLFIWSVFAPKLLIESCHSAVLFVEVALYYIIKNTKKLNMYCSYIIKK